LPISSCSAYVCIRLHTSAYVSIRLVPGGARSWPP
jgi:hypothetical protein